MGTLRTKWTDAKKKVSGIDAMFKSDLGPLLDKAESTYADYKKNEAHLEKLISNVGKVKTEAEKAEKVVKDYFTAIQSAKAKPGKTPAPFPDSEKTILKTALNQIAQTLAGYISEVKNKKLPTMDELKAWRGKSTSDAIKQMGM